MTSTWSKREDRIRLRPLASLGAALCAIASTLVAGPLVHASEDPPTPPLGTAGVEYTQPTEQGGSLRLRLDLPVGSTAILLVTRADPAEPNCPTLTPVELATAACFSVSLDVEGDLDLAAAAPADLPLSAIEAAGVRFRVAFFDEAIAGFAITDPIPLVSGATLESATTATIAADSDPASPMATETANVTAAGTNVATASSPSALATAVASSTTSTSQSSTTAGYTAPPQPMASKTNFGSGTSYSLPSPSSITFRLLTNQSLLSTHDQPSPIQGSGH